MDTPPPVIIDTAVYTLKGFHSRFYGTIPEERHLYGIDKAGDWYPVDPDGVPTMPAYPISNKEMIAKLDAEIGHIR